MLDDACCPAGAELTRFLLGELSDDEAEHLESHVADCPRCLQALDRLRAEDPLIAAVRRAQRVPVPPVLARLVHRLSQAPIPLAVPASEPAAGPPTREVYSLLLASPHQPDEIGRLGPYRVLRLLGSGGMGAVFEGEDPRLQRRVALKVMKPAMTTDLVSRQRFLQEARAAAAVEHPNIISIYQVDEDRGVPYLAMPLLRGENLATRLARTGKLPLPEVLAIGMEITAGLAAAHKAGLVHRDIKPANIFLVSGGVVSGGVARGEDSEATPADHSPLHHSPLTTHHSPTVKILDFGLAQVPRDQLIDANAVIVGTPAYMAPEQARGETVDQRSDLYSLGCVLYEMCTGAVPIDGTTTLELILALAVQEPRPPCELNPQVPPPLSDLIVHLLAKDPNDRPASARAVGDVLAGISVQPDAAGEAPSAIVLRLPSQPEQKTVALKSVAPSRRHRGPSRRLVVLGVAALLAGPLLLSALTRLGPRPDTGHQPDTGHRPDPVALAPTSQARSVAETPLPRLPDRPRPFRLIRGMAGQPQEFPDLAALQGGLRADDILEIHGNGPFPVGQLYLPLKGRLTVRAAPGYRPRFVARLDAGPKNTMLQPWLNFDEGPLLLEGCEFVNPYPDLVWLNGNATPGWEVRNCRLLSAGSVVAQFHGGRLRIVDSLIVLAPRANAFFLGTRAELELSNNILRTSDIQPLLVGGTTGGQAIHLRDNTCLTYSPWQIGLREAKGDALSIDAQGNLFWQHAVWREAPEALLKTRLHWLGRENLYVGPTTLTCRSFVEKPIFQGLPAWQNYWGGPEEGSQEASQVTFGWDLLGRLHAAADDRPLRQRTADLRRLDPTTLADVGPDWDRAGTGAAYQRAKPGTGPVRPEPPRDGPCVLWHGGQVVAGFAALAAAAAKAQTGDVIEVRTDGPLPAVAGVTAAKELTIRAGLGYRPVVDGTVDLWVRGCLTVEGIHFNNGLPRAADQVRLFNCSCSREDNRCNLIEAVNCLLTGRVRVGMTPGVRVGLRNSLVAGLSLSTAAEGDLQLDLDHCFLTKADLQGLLSCLGPVGGRLTVTATATIFESSAFPTPNDGELFGSNRGPILAGWTGVGNVYCLGPGPWLRSETDPVVDLAGWRRRWNSDTDSRTADPLFLDPQHWRLQSEIPGGKKYGADVGLIARPPG